MIASSLLIIAIFALLHGLTFIDPEKPDKRELIVANGILFLAMIYSLVLLHRPETPSPINLLEGLFLEIPVLRDIYE